MPGTGNKDQIVFFYYATPESPHLAEEEGIPKETEGHNHKNERKPKRKQHGEPREEGFLMEGGSPWPPWAGHLGAVVSQARDQSFWLLVTLSITPWL